MHRVPEMTEEVAGYPGRVGSNPRDIQSAPAITDEASNRISEYQECPMTAIAREVQVALGWLC